MFSDDFIRQLKSMGFELIKNDNFLEVYSKPHIFLFQILNEKDIEPLFNKEDCIAQIYDEDLCYLVMDVQNPKAQQTFDEYKGFTIENTYTILKAVALDDNHDVKLILKNNGETSQTSTIVANALPKTKELTRYNNLNQQDLPQNLFFIDYAKRYPYLNLYQQAICENPTITQDYKTFELYCTVVYIAMKSKLFKSKGNVCKIYPDDLLTILPKDLKRKPNSKEPKERTQYSKSYMTFINSAIEAGMLIKAEPNEEHYYLEITIPDIILNGIDTYPYNKIPFELFHDMNRYNFNFLMYFINRMFSIHPNKPYFVNIKVKELIKIANISINQSAQHCANRLNECFAILTKFGVISYTPPLQPIDVKRNKLLKFRLYKFNIDSIEEDEENEISSDTSSDDELDESTSQKSSGLTEAFLRANALVDKWNNSEV